MSLGLKLAIQGNFNKARAAYDKALPVARTRIVQRKSRQIHKRWKRDVSRLRGGMLSTTSFYGMAKAIRMGAPRKPELNPKSLNWSKAYRKDAKTGRIIDVIKVFEESRSINPRGSLYIPTEAAARLAGERFRRNVTPEMFKGQMIFLSRQGRRGTKGVLVHKDNISTVLFYVTGPVRLRKRFQSFERVAKRIASNLPELTKKELHREFNKLLRRL
jgi:hypothetical protein